ncbi:MAG: hypothetical protein FJ297_08820 [Planctomycetes bacterium]|nr:hypothetical protein [Planctomycetota bacterium]
MTMSTVFTILAVIVGFGLSMAAMSLLAVSLFPHWMDRASGRLSTMPRRTFLTGLVIGGVFLAVSVGTLRGGGPWGLVGGVLAALTAGFALFGSSAVARSIGVGLPSPADESRPWRRIVRGWIVLALACLFPVLGWFVILPAALLMGFGAAWLALFRRPVSESDDLGPSSDAFAAKIRLGQANSMREPASGPIVADGRRLNGDSTAEPSGAKELA